MPMLDIIDTLVRPQKTLKKIKINTLLQALANIPDILSAINNKEAKERISQFRKKEDEINDSVLNESATPKNISSTPILGSSKSKKRARARAQADASKETLNFETADEESFHDPTDPTTSPPKQQKGSGRRTKWLTLF